MGGQQTRGGEDCLNLAVFSPALRPAAPLPVIVFIHGGAFVLGSYTVYGPHQLLDRDVVLVTVHYRCPVAAAPAADQLLLVADCPASGSCVWTRRSPPPTWDCWTRSELSTPVT